MPLKRSRSPKGSSRRLDRPIPVAGAIPEIFVKAPSWRGDSLSHYIGARIQLRREKYRYLVWYEEGKKREFYLGAVKIVPRRAAHPGACRPARPAASSAVRAGGSIKAREERK